MHLKGQHSQQRCSKELELSRRAQLEGVSPAKSWTICDPCIAEKKWTVEPRLSRA